MFVNIYVQNYYSLVCWPLPRFLLLALRMWAYMGSSLLTLTIQVVLMPLGLVSTQAPLISHSTRSANLLFFQKALVVDLIRIKECKEQREGVFAWDKLNIQANAPSSLLLQSSVHKKGGGRIFRSLWYTHMTLHEVISINYFYVGSLRMLVSIRASEWALKLQCLFLRAIWYKLLCTTNI